jgi:hypothetical protein
MNYKDTHEQQLTQIEKIMKIVDIKTTGGDGFESLKTALNNITSPAQYNNIMKEKYGRFNNENTLRNGNGNGDATDVIKKLKEIASKFNNNNKNKNLNNAGGPERGKVLTVLLDVYIKILTPSLINKILKTELTKTSYNVTPPPPDKDRLNNLFAPFKQQVNRNFNIGTGTIKIPDDFSNAKSLIKSTKITSSDFDQLKLQALNIIQKTPNHVSILLNVYNKLTNPSTALIGQEKPDVLKVYAIVMYLLLTIYRSSSLEKSQSGASIVELPNEDNSQVVKNLNKAIKAVVEAANTAVEKALPGKPQPIQLLEGINV